MKLAALSTLSWLLPVKEYFTAAAIACLAWFAPVHGLMAAVGVLLAADLVTGILAAVQRGETITSRGLKRSVLKLTAYQVGVLTGYALEVLAANASPPEPAPAA